MNGRPTFFRFRTGGIAMRYRPRSPLCVGLLAAAHWLDLALLAVFLVLLSPRVLLRPGVMLSLPPLAAAGGSSYGHVLVVLTMERPAPGGGREAVVFFDDERYSLDLPEQAAVLRDRLGRAAARAADRPLLIEADRRVEHGALVQLYRMAGLAGINDINLVTVSDGTEPAETGGPMTAP